MLEVGRARPILVGLEQRPCEHDADMVRTLAFDGVEIVLDEIGIEVVPAVPPVAETGIVDPESVLMKIGPMCPLPLVPIPYSYPSLSSAKPQRTPTRPGAKP